MPKIRHLLMESLVLFNLRVLKLIKHTDMSKTTITLVPLEAGDSHTQQ